MIEKIVETNDFLTKSRLPASDYVINPYVGCTHACKYCYASFMKRFTNHNEPWGQFIDIKKCSKPINLLKIKGKTLFMSSVTDCYNHMEERYLVTRGVLEQLINADCDLTIGTKSKLILRDLDLLKQIKNLTVSMSINTLDEKFRADMDNACTIKERIETLKILSENNIKTVLFMSPIFPMITDFKLIIEQTKDYIDTYWFENLNLRGSYKSIIMQYIKNNFPQHTDIYDDIYNKKSKTFWQAMSKDIEEYCCSKNIKYINYFYHEEIRKK